MRYWKRLNIDGTTRTVESYSHNLEVGGAVEIPKQEFDAFVASMPITVEKPPRDLEAELDILKAKVTKLENS